MVPQLKKASYEETLGATGLPSIYYRHHWGHMVECYNFSHKMYQVAPMLDLNTISALRGYNLKLKKHHTKEMCVSSFSDRDTNYWDSLP